MEIQLNNVVVLLRFLHDLFLYLVTVDGAQHEEHVNPQSIVLLDAAVRLSDEVASLTLIRPCVDVPHNVGFVVTYVTYGH